MGGNAFPKFSGHIPVTDVVHHRIHQGLLFSLNLFNGSLANNGVLDILLRTAEPLHLQPVGQAGGDGTLALFENPTITDDGTLATPINHHRIKNIPSTTLGFTAPTISNVGTELDTYFLPGGIGGAAQGASGDQRIEWILKPNEDYLFRMTNLAGTAQPAHLQLDWYEPKVHPTV